MSGFFKLVLASFIGAAAVVLIQGKLSKNEEIDVPDFVKDN